MEEDLDVQIALIGSILEAEHQSMTAIAQLASKEFSPTIPEAKSFIHMQKN